MTTNDTVSLQHAHPRPRRSGGDNVGIDHVGRLHYLPRRPVTRPQDAVDRGKEMYMGTRLGGKVLDRDRESHIKTTHERGDADSAKL